MCECADVVIGASRQPVYVQTRLCMAAGAQYGWCGRPLYSLPPHIQPAPAMERDIRVVERVGWDRLVKALRYEVEPLALNSTAAVEG